MTKESIMNDSNNQKDKELEKLMARFRQIDPTKDQVTAWQEAVYSARKQSRVPWYRLRLLTVPQFAAALILAFSVGAFSFSQKTKNAISENFEPNATIEQIYAKAE